MRQGRAVKASLDGSYAISDGVPYQLQQWTWRVLVSLLLLSAGPSPPLLYLLLISHQSLVETKLIQNQLFVDGVHNHSTGSIYFYNELTMGDKNNYLQKYADSGQEVTLSINPSNSYKCLDSHSLDLNDWQCTRLVVTGSLVNMTDLEEVSSVKKTFKERHVMSLDLQTLDI